MPACFDAAPYGVYRWASGPPPGVTQPDNGLATMGRGQWLLAAETMCVSENRNAATLRGLLERMK